MTLTAQQHRHHGGHSHSHKHDSSYLVSTNKNDAGVRITRIGLYVNCLMAIGKATGGYFLNSQALMADAFHSLTDLVSDILTLGTVSYGLKPPSARFPSGYGKIESLGSLGVSSLLLAGGIGLGWHSIEILYNMWFVDAVAMAHDHAHHAHDHGHSASSIFSHSHSHNPADMGIPNVHAAWIAGGSIIIKEYLYRATIKIAKERKSSVLASNAVHHRIDSLTSIVALTAILGSNFFEHTSFLDPVGGLLVSLMVIKAGWGNTNNALLELADVGIDSDIIQSVKEAANKALVARTFGSDLIAGSDILVKEVQGIKAGQSYLVDIELAVPDTMAIKDTRQIEEAVREGLSTDVRGMRRVRVKFVSKSDETLDFATEFIGAGKPNDEVLEPAGHDHDHDHHDHHHNDKKDLNGTLNKAVSKKDK